MTDASEAFAPLTSTKDTLATFKNPFGFSLKVLSAFLESCLKILIFSLSSPSLVPRTLLLDSEGQALLE